MIRKIRYIIILILGLLSLGVEAQTPYYPDNSVLATGKWASVQIASEGVYKLTYNDFLSLGFEPQEIDFSLLSIYGNGGQPISDINRDYKQSDLQENAIYVNEGEKYALFFAKSTLRTTYNTADSTFNFSLHRFSDIATYFVTFDSLIGEKKRITLAEKIDQYDLQTSEAKDFVFHKRELVNVAERGDLWMGETILPTSSDLNIPLNTTNAVAGSLAKISISLAGASYSESSFNVKFSGEDYANISIPTIAGSSYLGKSVTHRGSAVLQSANNNLTLHYNPHSSTDVAWLDNIVVNYTKTLNFNNSYLKFYSTNFDNKAIRYSINNVRTPNVKVWDVTDILNVKAIDFDLDDNTLQFNVVGDTLRTYAVLAGASFPTPILGQLVANQNLHAMDPADFVIITYSDFKAAADSLATLHRDIDKIKVAVVDIQEVYNEFSSGTKDFLAMREFMRMLYNKYKETNQQPINLLLFGDGTYDNKDILGYNNNYIPTYQAKGSFSSGGEVYTSDDVLACLKDEDENLVSDKLMIGVGRLNVNSLEEGYSLVEKCRRYMIREDLLNGEDGEWRNQVMLTCDDADARSELYFIQNAEHIYQQIDNTQPGLNVQKVYSDAFKEYTSSSGATYPDATKTINDRMKKGVLLFNYLGHGSDDHLSGERLITKSDISGWTNGSRLPLMITSTCEFARYDLVDRQAAGEYIVASEHGAGIALIAAARKISSNDAINKYLHHYAVQRKDDGAANTFGEVIMNAKNHTNLYTAERSISLLGDPALRISLPKYNIRTLQINNSLFDTIEGHFNVIDTSHALSTMYIRGDITDFQGNKITDFNGKIRITLYDKKCNYYTLDNANIGENLEFEQQNNILHKGYTQVINGEFEHTFIIPKDIAYNYGYAKISYYAQNDSADATGYTNALILGGINSDVDLSEDRPVVNLFINDTSFVSGGITDENPSLYAVIYDTIPINTVGTGLGHDIVARLDNAANTFILNDFYIPDAEDENKGYITYPFTKLSEGEHTLSIKVWNIYNYSSDATIKFNVSNSQKDVYEVINYPNPFRETTSMMVRYNQANSITEATLSIFNAQGRLLKTINATPYINTYNIGPIEWDGTCDGGGKIGNGLYYYQVEMITNTGDKVRKTCKMLLAK